MAAHSSILAWKTPRAGEPDGLQCMGSERAGREWAHGHTGGHHVRSASVWSVSPDSFIQLCTSHFQFGW